MNCTGRVSARGRKADKNCIYPRFFSVQKSCNRVAYECERVILCRGMTSKRSGTCSKIKQVIIGRLVDYGVSLFGVPDAVTSSHYLKTGRIGRKEGGIARVNWTAMSHLHAYLREPSSPSKEASRNSSVALHGYAVLRMHSNIRRLGMKENGKR